MQVLSGLTFGVMVQPLAAISQLEVDSGLEAIPEVDNSQPPFRCDKCMAYVNPYFKFLDGGQKAQCNLCDQQMQVPDHYFCSTNEFSQRNDRETRPELHLGAYSFKMTDFLGQANSKQRFVFCIDTTQFAVESGFSHQAIQSIKTCLDSIENPTEICIFTFDVSLMFFNLQPSNEIQILHVHELENAFCPLPSSRLMLDVHEDREKIDAVFEKVSAMLGQYDSNGHKIRWANQVCTGAAVDAARDLLAESGKFQFESICLGGKIMVFTTSLPSLGAGKTSQRVNQQFFNKPEESSKMLMPNHDHFENLANECVLQNIAVDLFVGLADQN